MKLGLVKGFHFGCTKVGKPYIDLYHEYSFYWTSDTKHPNHFIKSLKGTTALVSTSRGMSHLLIADCARGAASVPKWVKRPVIRFTYHGLVNLRKSKRSQNERVLINKILKSKTGLNSVSK